MIKDEEDTATDVDRKRHHNSTDIANKRVHTEEYPNNSSNTGEFHWWLNGEDKVRAVRKEGKTHSNELFPKKYYICGEKKKCGCKATKTIHLLPEGDVIGFKGTHNHPPSSNPRIDPDVKKKVQEQLSVGAKPAMIHSKLVQNAEGPITSRNVPKKQHIHNWQHQMVMAQWPTGIFIIAT